MIRATVDYKEVTLAPTPPIFPPPKSRFLSLQLPIIIVLFSKNRDILGIHRDSYQTP
jgi:hypothetical protein